MEHHLEWFSSSFVLLALNTILRYCWTLKRIEDTILRKSNQPTTLTMGSCLGNFTSTNTNANNATTPTTPTTTCFWERAADGQDVELITNVRQKYGKRQNIIFRIMKFKNKSRKRTQYLDSFWDHSNLPNYDELTTSNLNDSLADIQMQNLDVNNLIYTSTYAKESTVNFAPGPAVTSSRASSSLDLEWEHEYVHMRPSFLHNQLTTRSMHGNHHQHFTVFEDYKIASHTMSERDSWQQMFNGDENQSENSESNAPSMQNLNATTRRFSSTTRSEKCRTKSFSRINGSVGSTGGVCVFNRNSSHNNSWSHISTPESLEWDIDEEQQRQLHVEDDNLDYKTLQLLHQIEQLKSRVLDETGDGLFEGRGESNMNDMVDGVEFKTNIQVVDFPMI